MLKFNSDEFWGDATLYTWKNSDGTWWVTSDEAEALRFISYGYQVFCSKVEWKKVTAVVVETE